MTRNGMLLNQAIRWVEADGVKTLQVLRIDYIKNNFGQVISSIDVWEDVPTYVLDMHGKAILKPIDPKE